MATAMTDENIPERIILQVTTAIQCDESPLMRSLQEFCEEHCKSLSGVHARASSVDPTTYYPQICCTLHIAYSNLVEDGIETILFDEGCSFKSFLKYIEDHSDSGQKFLRQLSALTSIDVFVQMMEDVRERLNGIK